MLIKSFLDIMQDPDYVIGKNAAENTQICQQAQPKDVWFHVKNLPSAHLVYKNINNQTLQNLRKNGTIYRLGLQLKNSTKYKKIPELLLIYTYIENITVTSTPGLVKTAKHHTIKI